MSPAPRFHPVEQEKIILDVAVNCIEQSSLLDFTMSAIAKEAGLSMGSIYKHVQTKEDVLIALACRVHQHKLRLYQAIVAMPLTTPEQIIAPLLIDSRKTRLYSFDSHLNALMNSDAILKRASKTWLEQMLDNAGQCDEFFNAYFRNAFNRGELASNDATSDPGEQLEIGTWAMTLGFQQIVRHGQMLNQDNAVSESLAPMAANAPIILSMQRFINTFNWRQPLTDDGILTTCRRLEEHGYR